jgi:hypothetical protein
MNSFVFFLVKYCKNKFSNFNKEIAFQDIQRKSDVLYIFGNGPSLKQFSFDDFIGNDLFVCNEFKQHLKFEEIAQNNNLIYFHGDNKRSFKDYAQDGFSDDFNNALRFFFENKFSFDYFTVVSHDIYSDLKKIFPGTLLVKFDLNIIKKYFLRILGRKYEEIINKAVDIRHTPNLMLLYGIGLGYKKIYLNGMDHSYVRDKLNNIQVQTHFFDEINEYISAAYSIAHRDLSSLFLDSHKTFELYKNQKDFAKIAGVKIIDLTINGCLDMFEKKDYDLGRNN